MDFKYTAAGNVGKDVEDAITKLSTVPDGVIGKVTVYKDVTIITTITKSGGTEDGSGMADLQTDLSATAADIDYALSSIEARFVDSYVSSTN